MRSVVALALLFITLAAQADVCHDSLAGANYSKAISELAESYLRLEKMKIENLASGAFINRMIVENEKLRQELIAKLGETNFNSKFQQALSEKLNEDHQTLTTRKNKVQDESSVLALWLLTHSLVDSDKYVTEVAFSPDGQFIATTNYRDHWLRIWDTKTGELLRKFEFENALGQVEFSPDGKTLLVTESTPLNRKGRTYYFDFLTGKTRNSLIDTRWNYKKYSPDGQFVITTPAGDRAVVDLKTSTEWAELSESLIAQGAAGLGSANFSTDGKKLVTKGGDIIEIWDVQTRKKEKSFRFDRTNTVLESPRLSPNEKFIIAVADRKEFWLIDAVSGEHLKSFGLGIIEGSFYDTTFVNDRYLILFSDLAAYYWDLEENQYVKFEIEEASQLGIVRPDENILLVKAEDSLNIWDLETSKSITRINKGEVTNGQDVTIQALKMSPDGKTIAAGLSNGKVSILRKTKVEE